MNFKTLGKTPYKRHFTRTHIHSSIQLTFRPKVTERTREIKVSSPNEVFTSSEKCLHSDTTSLHCFLVRYCLATKEKWAKLQVYRPRSWLTASVCLHSYAFVLTSLKIWQWSAVINCPIIVTFRIYNILASLQVAAKNKARFWLWKQTPFFPINAQK